MRVQDKFAYRGMVWKANLVRMWMGRARLHLRFPSFCYWRELELYFPFALSVVMGGKG